MESKIDLRSLLVGTTSVYLSLSLCTNPTQDMAAAKATGVYNASVEVPVSEEVLALKRQEETNQLLDALTSIMPLPDVPNDAWLSTFGIFKDDAIMQEISDEARRISNSQRAV